MLTDSRDQVKKRVGRQHSTQEPKLKDLQTDSNGITDQTFKVVI